MGAFPQEFIDKVKARYPDGSDGLYRALEQSDPSRALVWLGRYVYDELVPGFSAQHIIEMIEADRSDELLAEAQAHLADVALYNEASEYAYQVPHPWQKQG